MIEIGKVYHDDIMNLYYVVVAYYPSSVPGTPIGAPTYEVMRVDEPEKKIYAAPITVEGWKPC